MRQREYTPTHCFNLWPFAFRAQSFPISPFLCVCLYACLPGCINILVYCLFLCVVFLYLSVHYLDGLHLHDFCLICSNCLFWRLCVFQCIQMWSPFEPYLSSPLASSASFPFLPAWRFLVCSLMCCWLLPSFPSSQHHCHHQHHHHHHRSIRSASAATWRRSLPDRGHPPVVKLNFICCCRSKTPCRAVCRSGP